MTTSREQLVQVRRMLGLAKLPATEREAAEAIAGRIDDFAVALFAEAAASDDVTSAESALEYCDDRLASFEGMISGHVAEAIRARFAVLVRAWE